MTTLPKHELTQARYSTVVREIARHYGVDRAELTGRTRLSEVVSARKALVLILATAFDTSYSQIGRLIGRDHSTVSYFVGESCRRLSSDEEYRRVISRLIGTIESAIEAQETTQKAA